MVEGNGRLFANDGLSAGDEADWRVTCLVDSLGR